VAVERFVIDAYRLAEALPESLRGPTHRQTRARQVVGAAGRALHSREPATGAACVLPARARERRRPRHLELDRSRARTRRDLSGVSRRWWSAPHGAVSGRAWLSRNQTDKPGPSDKWSLLDQIELRLSPVDPVPLAIRHERSIFLECKAHILVVPLRHLVRDVQLH
jgi:hypothetical protein